jgi:hypothetical protein
MGARVLSPSWCWHRIGRLGAARFARDADQSAWLTCCHIGSGLDRGDVRSQSAIGRSEGRTRNIRGLPVVPVHPGTRSKGRRFHAAAADRSFRARCLHVGKKPRGGRSAWEPSDAAARTDDVELTAPGRPDEDRPTARIRGTAVDNFRAVGRPAQGGRCGQQESGQHAGRCAEETAMHHPGNVRRGSKNPSSRSAG